MNQRVCLFIRVSSEKQSYDRQILELNSYCINRGYKVARIIATKITGSKTQKDRPDLIELIARAKKNEFDKVLVTEVSRIGRNAKDVRNVVDQLHSMGIGIIFKNLGVESLDETGNESFVTNIITSIYAELAQEEKRILVERIKSGLVAARNRGKRLGRPSGKTDNSVLLKKYRALAKDLREGLSLRKASKVHGVSKGTVLKVKKAQALK